MSCKGFDEQVVRHDKKISELMEQFVRVRIIQGNGMDLSIFQFDYDLTFAAFFLMFNDAEEMAETASILAQYPPLKAALGDT